MARARTASMLSATAEELLEKATLARSSGARAKYASRGLERAGELDTTTHAMLLRQLYLSHMEARRFDEALATAERMLGLDVMPDVARQDAARACLGLGDVERATAHLRLASRVSPPARRAFHLWTLGSVLYLQGRPRDAIGPLERAVRWGTTDKPLYLAQAGLVRLALGEPVPELSALRDELADSPCGQGYGQFVLGELALALGDHDQARHYLTAFVRRTTSGRVALTVALAGEIARAEQLLREDLRAKRRART